MPEATTQHQDPAALGARVERVVRPLAALVERMQGYRAHDEDDRLLELADRAHDVASFSAKELQDLREATGGFVASPEVESEFNLAQSLIVAVNAMAVLIDSGVGGSDYSFPPSDEVRWKKLPTVDQVVEAMVWLGVYAEDRFVTDGACGRWERMALAERDGGAPAEEPDPCARWLASALRELYIAAGDSHDDKMDIIRDWLREHGVPDRIAEPVLTRLDRRGKKP